MAQGPSKRDPGIEREGGPLGSNGGSADELGWEAPTRPDRTFERDSAGRADGEGVASEPSEDDPLRDPG